MASTTFKKYQREERVQLTEESFKSGMYFTHAPLKEGHSRVLVNFNYKDNGDSLTPRSGLRVTETGVLTKFLRYGDSPPSTQEGMILCSGKSCKETNSLHYKQVILGTPTTNKINETNLVTGEAYAATVYEDSTFDGTTAQPPVLSEGVTQDMYINPLGTVTFLKPSKAMIHGLTLTDSAYIARQVGVHGYNNSYYFFRKAEVQPEDGTVRRELAQTRFQTRFPPGTMFQMDEQPGEIRNPYCYKAETVAPRALTPKEAAMWGYNMLEDNPYTFSNSESAGGIQFLGMLPYNESGELSMSPSVNKTMYLECFYTVKKNDKYTIEWDWKEPGAPTWTTFHKETITFSSLPDLKAEFSSPVDNVIVRVTATGWTDDTENTYVAQVLAVGLNLDKSAYGSTANIKPGNYDLTTASGITFWKNRLVLYGVKEDPTILFMSDTNDPGYFPYPNNVDLLNEPIIYALPFLDDLLVFTASKLYLLTLTEDGLFWSKRLIQDNFDIKEWDIHLIQVVKNMVFFKSGNYYYMVVPKLNSMSGELTIAPISKFMENFFDNFEENIKDVLDTTYSYKKDIELIHYYNFLDFEDIHNIYVFQTEDNILINIDLLYNTLMRNWRIHVYESQNILVPYKQDATKKGTLMKLVSADQRFENVKGISRIIFTQSAPLLQFLNFSDINVADLYIPQGFKIYPEIDDLEEEVDNIYEKFKQVHIIPNYQFLDTGYREHASDYKKRYREFQLKFNNVSQTELAFYTEFDIDGERRKSFYKYEIQHETDPNNENYGLLYVEQIYDDPTILPSVTILAGDIEEDDVLWRLDNSLFPNIYLWKVRFPISGKGYAPRLKVVSRNEHRYELLNTAWVFRTLYSR